MGTARRNKFKDADCATFDIPVLRITNAEVFGHREVLIGKLHSEWHEALSRQSLVIGLS